MFRPSRKLLGLFAAAQILLLGCGDSDSSSNPNPVADSSCSAVNFSQSNYKGLLLASVAPDYSSSDIFFLDFQSTCLRLLLSGQSGDPLLKTLGGQPYLFNRTESNYNFVGLQPNEQAGLTSFQLGTQLASPLAGYGDPSAVLALTNGELLMTGRSEQAIRQVRPVTGEAVASLQNVIWDLGGQPFYPNDLLVQEVAGGYRAHVLHGFYEPNGSQQSFVIEHFQDGLQALDLNAEQEAVQGIALAHSIPSQYLYKDRERPLVVSVCTYFADDDCRQGVERLDLNALRVESSSFNLDLVGERTYSGVLEASTDGVGEDFFIRSSLADGSARQVVRVSDPFGTPNIRTIHRYDAASTGEPSIFFDPSSALLFVGESFADGRGRLFIYRDDKLMATLDLEGMPYSGTLVP